MSALDFSPAPAAAPRTRRIGQHARIEATLLVRNGEQLLLALVIPLMVLVGGRFLGNQFGFDLATVVPSVLTLAVWSTGFTSLAIATGFERRYGVLERLASTPLTRGDLIAGKALSLAVIVAGQMVILGVVALVLGWQPVLTVGATAVALLAIVLALTAFSAFAMILAGRLRAEMTLGLANLIYLLLLGGGAVLFPVASYPPVLQPVLSVLPTAALGEALRGAAGGEALAWPLLVLATWAGGGVLIARKVFQWMS